MKAGNSSLAVTLPKGWVDYYELKPGDEVEVITDNNEMIVRLKKQYQEKERAQAHLHHKGKEVSHE